MPTAANPMRLDHIAEIAVEHLLGRLIRRAFIALAFGLFAITALYHFTIGGLLTLEAITPCRLPGSSLGQSMRH